MGFKYNTQTWSGLSDDHKKLIKDFEDKEITRGDVIQAYETYYKDGTDVMIPFLLAMVWGFADTGYGTHRTNNYLNNTENIEKIKQSVDAIKNHDIKKAFKTLKKIKGLGVSYITKVLYFASKAAGFERYTLIFDIRVAKSLVQLTTPSKIFEIVSVSPSSKYEDYEKYNNLLHRLAHEYDLEADAIELFLFEREFQRELNE
jgi:hypothetical protein